MRNVSAVKFLADVLVWAALTPLAFLLRLEGNADGFVNQLLAYGSVALVVKVVALYGARMYLRPWRWVSVRDLRRLLIVVGAVTVVLTVGVLIAFGFSLDRGVAPVPRSVPIIEGLLAVLALSGLRMVSRLRNERQRRPQEAGKRVLIVGAGEAGVMLAREMLRHPEAALTPVGFLDDKEWKTKQPHLGLPVFGALSLLEETVREQEVDEVLIAMPSAKGDVIRGIVEASQRAGVPSRAVPTLTDLASGEVEILQFRDIDVEDLLRREPVRLEPEPIRAYLKGKRVMVTGAGGSIGSEIVRQVAQFGPAQITLLGRGENSVYLINREMAQRWGHIEREAVICDVRDRHSLHSVFERFKPEVVFHAAAHKHVPLMEANPEQAVWNNVMGTRNVAELCSEHGVERLVNISTDKAVNPTNVMGASKRVAEKVVADVASRSECLMASVRFGNVLGSRGSVVPLFRDQIKRGGPITVTHPDMVRYFMTIPEAAQLVLQAGALDDKNRVYVLDMGDPVKIADLASDLILLSGLEPGVDIEIVFSGARPGEKLFEELLLAEEGIEASPHEKIFVARKGAPDASFPAKLEALLEAAQTGSDQAVRDAFQYVVPSYKPESAAPEGSGRSEAGPASGDGSTLEPLATP